MIKLIAEPVGKDYKLFIEFVALRCSLFSLVWKYEMALDESTKTVYEMLKGHQVSEEIIKNKRLTDQSGVFPMLRKYLVDHESIRILKDSPSMFAHQERESEISGRKDVRRKPGLFSWVSPCLPEDLTFYSKMGNVWLESVSHQEEFYMYDSKAVDDLLHQFPSIRRE